MNFGIIEVNKIKWYHMILLFFIKEQKSYSLDRETCTILVFKTLFKKTFILKSITIDLPIEKSLMSIANNIGYLSTQFAKMRKSSLETGKSLMELSAELLTRKN